MAEATLTGAQWLRFWAKVRIRSDDECWDWTAAKTPEGYGKFAVGSRTHRAHRLSFEAYKGTIPADLILDHLCRNTSCVNPKHLEATTQQQNVLRGQSQPASQARQTHCLNGHELNEANTYTWKRERHCKACRRIRAAEARRSA